jgi:hypothetical protein
VLGSIGGVCDPVTVMRQTLAVMLRVLDSDTERGETIAKKLYQLFASKLLPEEVFGNEPSYLDELFELNSPEEALARLRAYLGRESLPPGDSG